MSQAAPGYVLWCQTPPTRSPRSNTVTSSYPARRSMTAAPTPPKPAPTTAIERCEPTRRQYLRGSGHGRPEHAVARAPVRGVRSPRRRRDGGLLRPDAHFNDPVFGDLTGEEAGAMWRMLTGRATTSASSCASTRPTSRPAPRTGSRATRSPRPACRRQRRAGRVPIRRRADHRAHRPLQLLALVAPGAGPSGTALGWTPLLRRKVGANARAGLDAFMARGDEFRLARASR